jgi:hypothetical protein
MQIYNPMVFIHVGQIRRTIFTANICWYLKTSEWPSQQIDHKDRDPCNNKFTNLRLTNSAILNLNKNSRNNMFPGV